MGNNLHHGEGLNFGKERRIPLQPFVLKGNPANYYYQARKGWGILLHSFNLIQSLKSLYHHILQTH